MRPRTENNYHNLKYLCLKDFHSHIGHKPTRTLFQYVMINMEGKNYYVQAYTSRQREREKTLPFDLI